MIICIDSFDFQLKYKLRKCRRICINDLYGVFFMRMLMMLMGIVFQTACFHDTDEAAIDDGFLKKFSGDIAQSDKVRLQPQISDTDLDAQITGNVDFSLGLYKKLSNDSDFQNKNIVFSPFSISLAMAMLSAGAANNTLEEINQSLNFDSRQAVLHNAFNSLDLGFASRAGNFKRADSSIGEIELNISNDLWGQEEYDFEATYLDNLAENYAAGMYLMDFSANAELARTEINQWISSQTKNKITDAMPQGSVTNDTRLVLTNTVYLKGSWFRPFDASLTSDSGFELLDGTIVSVPFMNQQAEFAIYQAEDVTAVEMTMVGEQLALLVLMPAASTFTSYESTFDRDKLSSILMAMQSSRIQLSMPKFDFKFDLPLKEKLKALGVVDAFNPMTADFSRIDGNTGLYVQSAIHKAFITVDEVGAEAGAFTGFSIGVTSVPPSIVIDKSFLFLIRDKTNGSILFFGRVLDPSI